MTRRLKRSWSQGRNVWMRWPKSHMLNLRCRAVCRKIWIAKSKCLRKISMNSILFSRKSDRWLQLSSLNRCNENLRKNYSGKSLNPQKQSQKAPISAKPSSAFSREIMSMRQIRRFRPSKPTGTQPVPPILKLSSHRAREQWKSFKRSAEKKLKHGKQSRRQSDKRMPSVKNDKKG